MRTLAAALAILRDAYPRQDFPDPSVRMYAHALADLDDEAVCRAVERIVRRSQWLPTISQIRIEVAEERLALPTVEEAWNLVRNGGSGAWPEPVRQAMNDIGGHWAIRTADRPDVLFSQFRRAYESRRARMIEMEIGAAAFVTPQLTAPAEVRELPVSTRIRPRPIMARLATRFAGRSPGAPNDEEVSDAIAILRDGQDGDDPLYREAERLLIDWGVAPSDGDR